MAGKGKKEGQLKSFKIGDMRRPEVRPGAPKKSDDGSGDDTVSAGFPAIETRLESMSIEDVAEELRSVYSELETLSEEGSKKDKAAALKAMAAYERCADLFEYLFATKAALQEQAPESQ